MSATLFRILRQKPYALLAIGGSMVSFILIPFTEEFNMIWGALSQDALPWSVKLIVVKSAIAHTLFISGVLSIIIAVLLGINISVIAYYMRNRLATLRASGSATSILGMIVGIFGLGCAACGSFIFTTLIPFFGLGTFLSALPLHGREFALLGVLLLVVSLWMTLRQIQNPKVCRVV